MSLLRQNHTTVAERPSALITIRMIKKDGTPLDASDAWAALLKAFEDHKTLAVKTAEIKPDKNAD